MKHNLFSRFISVLLAVVMLAGLMSMPSLADTVTGTDAAATDAQTTDSVDVTEENTTDEAGSAPATLSEDGEKEQTVTEEESGEPAAQKDTASEEANASSEEENTSSDEENVTAGNEEEGASSESEAAGTEEESSSAEKETTTSAAVRLEAEATDANGTVVANVTAEADEGVIPEGATLVADLLTGNDAEVAGQELDEAGVEYDGYMALDIHLEDADGNEVEPNGEVRVLMVAPAALPENADPNTVTVQHHEEQADGQVQVEEVASAAKTDATPAALSAEDTSAEQPATGVVTDDTDVTAAFDVESFSTFTITWEWGWTPYKITWEAATKNGDDFSVIGQGEVGEESGNSNDTISMASLTPGEIEVGDATYTYTGKAWMEAGSAISQVIAVKGATITVRSDWNRTRYNIIYVTVEGMEDIPTKVEDYRVLAYKNQNAWEWTNNADAAKFYLEYKTQSGVKIEDDIIDTGHLNVLINNQTPTQGYTYEWTRNGESVEKTKVTGSQYNYEENWLNVALDIEGLCLGKSDGDSKLIRSTEYTYQVTVKDGDGTIVGSDSYTVPYYAQLMNGGFETPVIDYWNNQLRNGYKGLVWRTTGVGTGDKVGQDIEIVRSTDNEYVDGGTTFQEKVQQIYSPSSAAEGDQFAELNCEAFGALYQDVLTTPETTLNWALSHCGRVGADTMALVIMPTSQAESATALLSEATTTQQIRRALQRIEKQGAFVKEFTSDKGEWSTYSGTYNIGLEQYLTRFFFVAVGTASEESPSTVGNLIDNVWFSPNLPDPDPDTGHLKITKEVSGINKNDVAAGSFTFQVLNEEDEVIEGFSLPDSNGSWQHAIQNLTIGTYTVKEEVPNQTIGNYRYEKTTINSEDTLEAEVTISNGQTTDVTVKNNYVPNTGEIVVTKTISGLENLASDKMAALKNSLTFTCTNVDDSSDTRSVTLANMQEDPEGTYTYTFDGLTVGQEYTVTESGQMIDDYSCESHVPDGTFTIRAETPGQANFSNTYTWAPQGTLTVSKTLTNFNSTMGKDAVFQFEVEATYGAYDGRVWHVNLTFDKAGTATADLTGLPVGTYTVKELDSAGYTLVGDSEPKTITISPDGTSPEVASFTNDKAGDNTPGDQDIVRNNFVYKDGQWQFTQGAATQDNSAQGNS